MDYKVGTWTPDNAVLPSIDKDCIFAQFYITNSGKIDGLNIDFKEGNWLIYIKDHGKDNWFQADGTVVVNTAQNNLFPKAGFYSKIQLDNAGNVIGYGQLNEEDLSVAFEKINPIYDKLDELDKKITSSTIHSNLQSGLRIDKTEDGTLVYANVDEDTIMINHLGQLSINTDTIQDYLTGGGGSSGCANHTHEISQIEGLEEFIDDKFLNVSFKPSPDWVDGQTITLNENGQLIAISSSAVEHTHLIEDIEDFPHEYMHFASDQYFQNIDFTNGRWDFSLSTIGESFKKLNETALDLETRLEEVEKLSGKVKPAEPYKINNTELNYSVNGLIDVVSVKTLEKTQAGTGFSVESEMIYPREGVLSLIVDDVEVKSWNVKSTPTDELTFTYTGDFYETDVNYQGFFEGFKFKYSHNEFTEGNHIVKFNHTFNGETISSKSFNFNSYLLPTGDRYIMKEKIKDVVNNKVISGIPCYSEDQIFEVSPYVENFTSGKYFPVDFAKSGEDILDVLEIKDDIIYFKPIPIELKKGMEQVEFSWDLFGFSGINIKHSEVKSSKVFYNTTEIEQKYRTKAVNYNSTKIPENNPSMSFRDWESTVGLFNGEHECYIIDDIAYSNIRDFSNTGGPTYNKDFGEEINGRFYKWVELKIPIKNRIKSISLQFKDENNELYSINKDGSLDGILVYFGFSKNNNPEYYVDGQKYYIPWTKLEGRSFNGLNLIKSTDNIRSYTLGSTDFDTKDTNLYLLLAIEKSLNLKNLVDILLKSIEKNKY